MYRAEAIAAELNQRFPHSTLLNNIWLPAIRARIALSRGDPGQAIKLLQVTLPNDLAQNPPYRLCTLPASAGRPICGRNNPMPPHKSSRRSSTTVALWGTPPVAALAHLGLAHAYVLAGDSAKARTKYQDFFALWKDADPDNPDPEPAVSRAEKVSSSVNLTVINLQHASVSLLSTLYNARIARHGRNHDYQIKVDRVVATRGGWRVSVRAAI